jgi:subtilisin family serine protease
MYVDGLLNAPSQGRKLAESTPYGIGHVNAEQVSDANVSNMKVCIVDSGYDIEHEDLPSDPSLVTGVGFAGDWDKDPNSHGTHVAGTIAALGGNGIGVKGVVRNGQMKLHIGRVFNRFGFGSTSDIIDALINCVEVEANVVNMSLGGGGYMQIFQDEINEAANQGVLVVAAAGNSGSGGYEYPASYENVMAVASIDENYQRSSFSTFNDEVDISGPGSDVLSTTPNDKYSVYSGTSMACPHVAGVAALVWSHAPETPLPVFRQLLKDTALDLGTSGYDNFYGNGLVDAKNAFDNLGEAPVPCYEANVILKTDNNPQQSSWEIVDTSTGSIVASKDDFSDASTIYSDSVCLPVVPGCAGDDYTFTIKDSQGNGLGNGAFYRVVVEGERYDDGTSFTGSEAMTDLPGCADEGPRCLDFETRNPCKDTDGCFFYQGSCFYCAALSQNQCNGVAICSWNGSACE